MTVVQRIPIQTMFDENAKKYMCFYGCMHYLGVLGVLVYKIIYLGGEIPLLVIICLAVNMVYVASIVLALYGIQAEDPCCLLPYAVLQAIVFLGGLSNSIVLIVNLVTAGFDVCGQEDFHESCYFNTLRMIVISSQLITFVFKVWILIVIARYYKYLRAKHFGYRSQIKQVEAYQTQLNNSNWMFVRSTVTKYLTTSCKSRKNPLLRELI